MTENQDIEGTVLVGEKSLGKYISACLAQLGDYDEVELRARGRKNIGKAVDVAEIVKRKHEREIAEISSETHSNEGEDGESFKTSAISIKLE